MSELQFNNWAIQKGDAAFRAPGKNTEITHDHFHTKRVEAWTLVVSGSHGFQFESAPSVPIIWAGDYISFNQLHMVTADVNSDRA